MGQETVRVKESRPPAQPIDDLKEIAKKSGDLPPLPAVAMQALEVARDSNTSAKDLQAVISKDQGLTARILRIVNSAMYCLRREVSTISHAIAILGMEAVSSVIIGASVRQVFGSAAGKDLGTKLLADHSWGTAVAARCIATYVKYETAEEASLCGLIHDMGKVVLSKNKPKEYAKIIADVYGGGTTFHEAELRAFGFSHAHVGAVLAARWNFPEQLAEAILYHHNPIAAPLHTRLACIVNLANLVMIFMEVGFEKNKDLELSRQPAAEDLRLDKAALENLLCEVQEKMSAGSPL